ncbi:Protein FAM192A NEFA-interacting nuclear protein NIP30 [Collichthys lucidus]|uniref:Protein FAM192A NEFA-interacting nuclear protein NIP30 n=1 Tax=Collichthys lucidus TaxID=240159 RepID=A0A4U5UHW0_COLLU|nr:Protein FAM192A NEFA-interacting nuclear protein NIP30 [Collichthys lucidus]
MAGGGAPGVDLSRKFVSETELDEKRKKRQEEWEKVRKPEDPEEAPEEEYDPRSLFERLQEQKDKKQEEYEEQFKFRNMVRGLDEDESSFLDEVSRQQCLVEKQRRDEEKQELLEYRISFLIVAFESVLLEAEQLWLGGPEQRTSHLSQAHLLAGAVKRRRYADTHSSKKQKPEAYHFDCSFKAPETRTSAFTSPEPDSVLHLPSAAVCVGVLPGLWVYSGSSDSDSSSDSEGSVDAIIVIVLFVLHLGHFLHISL